MSSWQKSPDKLTRSRKICRGSSAGPLYTGVRESNSKWRACARTNPRFPIHSHRGFGRILNGCNSFRRERNRVKKVNRNPEVSCRIQLKGPNRVTLKRFETSCLNKRMARRAVRSRTRRSHPRRIRAIDIKQVRLVKK